MNRYQKDLFLMDEDEIYGEAQRRIRECREKGGKKLDFSCLHLTKIPPEIAELETLQELDITNIELKEIPAFLGNIASLKKLSVGSDRFGRYENEDVTLPSQPGNLRNLHNLSIGYGISVIPPWVYDLENLEALSIYNNTVRTIPAHIANIKKLRKLRVYGDNITSLPQEIGERPALTVLDLGCPKLGALPESFAHLKTMQSLRLVSCNFTVVPGFICGWTNLEELQISMENSFQGPYTALKALPKNTGDLQKLKYLILDAAGIVKIPDSLGSCPLQYLNLSGNYKTIPETFGNLSHLKMLNLFSGKPITLPDSFGNLHTLKELAIYAPAVKIPPSFGGLASLEKLDIDTEKDIILPKTIGKLSALREIIVRSPEMQSIPNAIGVCKNLKKIRLDSDKLTTLPESLCSLKKMEELYLDTFALKRLPAAFGSLCSLKTVDIFSGALTALPESMGSLKNLQSLCINAVNVKEAPSSFKMLSYVKEPDIKIGSEKPARLSADRKKKRGAACLSDLSGMNYRYCWKLLETYSLKEIESLLCSAPLHSTASEEEKYLFGQIMVERRQRLNKKFKWTDENKQRMVKVSDAFLQAWEDGFAKAKKMIEALNPVGDEYTAEIVLYPDITDYKEDGNYHDRIYSVITDYLDSGRKLSMCFHGLPADSEEKFRESIHVRRNLSWNIEGLGDIELKDSYICYALHILYSHNEWAFEDILKINNISTEIRITGNSGEF
ncbi:MAG: hypothetical protein LBQ89_02155 [Treponema sp.]|jgi:Leucine-rich repeat (LRR) protein|nr:hypothetical protein [Treponema sp.]